MTTSTLDHSIVAVLGGGNMGSGIAQAAAQAGYRVRVRDINDEAIARGRSLIEKTLDGAIERRKLTPQRKADVLSRVEFLTDPKAAVAGARFVIEAVFEEESVKRALFQEIAGAVEPRAIVATNTSSLSVTRLAEGFPEPQRFGGLHFFFPAAVNKLVEVIAGVQTAPATLEELERFSYRLRKIPIHTTDRAGFAVNRFFVPFLNESTRIVDEGLASIGTVEAVGRELFGTTLGPFELMNVTGIPIAFHAQTSLAAAFGAPYAPSRLLESQFRAGVAWDWRSSPVQDGRRAAVRDRLLGMVLGISTRLVEEGVATAEATDRGATVGLRWAKGPFALLSEAGVAASLALVEGYAAPWGVAFPVSQELRERAARGDAIWPMKFVRVERRGPVAWVLLDRPEVLNSLNSTLLAQLDQAFRDLDKDAEIRVVVLAGASPVFAAGADIAEMASKDLAAGREFGFYGQSVCRRIEEFRAPVLALVEGYALGGGLELALACDLILAAEGSQLGLPEVTVGIHPGFGGASRLTRLIGPARTKLLVYSGTPVSSEEAARLGFVVRVLSADSARAETQALAESIAQRAPLAVAWIKRVINHSLDSSLESSLRLEGESAGATFGTADRTEGMRAFLERRPPKFQGK